MPDMQHPISDELAVFHSLRHGFTLVKHEPECEYGPELWHYRFHYGGATADVVIHGATAHVMVTLSPGRTQLRTLRGIRRFETLRNGKYIGIALINAMRNDSLKAREYTHCFGITERHPLGTR